MKKGFTLIELLIVIAIIGILAGAVIVAISNRDKDARDAVHKSDLAQLRTSIIAYGFDNNGSYSDYCDEDTDGSDAKQVIGSIAGGIAGAADAADITGANSGVTAYTAEASSKHVVGCKSTSDAWVFWVKLQKSTDPISYWCLDSEGFGEEKEIGTGANDSKEPEDAKVQSKADDTCDEVFTN